ncbi:MAG: glycosyltransferase [Patescibacteria group bacterium]
MRKKRKLAIVVKSVDGGTGTYLLTLQKLRGFEIRNFILEKPKYRQLPFPTKKNSVFFHRKGFYPPHYFISLRHIVNFLEEIFWLQKKVASFNPDVVIGVDIHANLLTMICKLFSRRKFLTVLTTHINLEKTLTEKSTPPLKDLITKIASFFYNKADYNLCVSNGVARSLETTLKLKKEPVVIYNGVPLVKNKKTKTNQNIIISIARFDEQKDLESLVKAFLLVQKKIPDSQLWLGGEGPQKPSLERLVKKLGLTDKAKFLGWIDPSFISRADVFVLSSKREGFSYVLLEAMALGLPVISTDTPFGPPEILENGEYGILVAPGKVRVLASSIIEILRDRGKASLYARKSRERSKFFSEEKMLSAYERLVSSLT